VSGRRVTNSIGDLLGHGQAASSDAVNAAFWQIEFLIFNLLLQIYGVKMQRAANILTARIFTKAARLTTVIKIANAAEIFICFLKLNKFSPYRKIYRVFKLVGL
jgi:hypothetical protein